MSESDSKAAGGPLAGLRVIDFTHVLAGPACAYYLGLLGAEVIKVESAWRGDAMRYRGGTDEGRSEGGMSTAYLTQAAGKRSVALDLETPAGRAVMERLLASADVLVENHLPRTMQSLGFDDDRLKAINPRLIRCAMTGYGRGGELENAPAYDVNIQAACGIMTLTGTGETGPLRTGAPIMDYGTALAAGFAIASALYERERTGEGTFIDVSMLETAFTLMSATITDYLATGNAPRPRGNAANSRSPGAGNFTCKEGVISLGVNEDSQFQALARVLNRDHWLTDPRFADRRQRKTNAGILEAELAATLKERTARDWEREMLQNGVPAACLRSLPESLALAQTAERQFLHADPATGLQVPTLPFRIGAAKVHAPGSPAPRHGQHTDEVLGELGYSASEVSALREARAPMPPAGERPPRSVSS